MTRTKINLIVVLLAAIPFVVVSASSSSYAIKLLSMRFNQHKLLSLLRHPNSKAVSPATASSSQCTSTERPDTLDKLKDGKDAVGLTCTGCHGGNPAVSKTSSDPQEIRTSEEEGACSTIVPICVEEKWSLHRRQSGTYEYFACERRAGNSFAFINPGDLRVVAKTCAGGACHEVESKNVGRSMMTHGAMLWGAGSL
jgi:hypothetical protein